MDYCTFNRFFPLGEPRFPSLSISHVHSTAILFVTRGTNAYAIFVEIYSDLNIPSKMIQNFNCYQY